MLSKQLETKERKWITKRQRQKRLDYLCIWCLRPLCVSSKTYGKKGMEDKRQHGILIRKKIRREIEENYNKWVGWLTEFKMIPINSRT